MTFHEDRATSFGNVAQSYDRVRPGPPAQALDWLVTAGCEVAVDLAAGPGLFTRALLGRTARVVAVEPDARMREVLARRSPQVDMVAGAGEAMPLPDMSADAVFVSRTGWPSLTCSGWAARVTRQPALVPRAPSPTCGPIWTASTW